MKTAVGERSRSARSSQPNSPAGLPLNSWGWECVPSVVRYDGAEQFRLEVEAGDPVSNLMLKVNSFFLDGSATGTVEMLDDGVSPDVTAGDDIYTAGPWLIKNTFIIPSHYRFSSEGISNMTYTGIGNVTITRTDGSTNTFLIEPMIGVLSTNVPSIPFHALSPEVVVTPHLVNVINTNRQIQKQLHGIGGQVWEVTSKMYDVLPDRFHFINFFSTDHLEKIPRSNPNNFNAGMHLTTSVDFTGTGRAPFNNSALYGSGGRLHGVNLMDTGDRGIYSANFAHEIMHLWAYYGSVAPSIGGGAHYEARSSVGSLLGGFEWATNGGGGLLRNCVEGRNGGHYAPPLDKYLMGFIPGSNVPPQHVHFDTSVPLNCGLTITAAYQSVTITQIQAADGVRTPGPASALRDFRMAFVTETHDRFLTDTERTFYDALAAYAVSSVPSNAPDPYLGFNWVPVERYFSEGSTWLCGVGGILDIDTAGASNVNLTVMNLPLRGEFDIEESIDLPGGSWTNGLGPYPPPPDYDEQFLLPADTPAKFYRLWQE